jgi:D-glycero-alpha-D-manno-heptose-7-phosphate kinase
LITSRTPLRVSLFGGGSDYAAYYLHYGEGAVLGTTIDKYTYVMVHNGQSWHTYDLPNKSGLASSSAYTVGLLRACTELDNRTIARLATTWEFDKMGGNVGSQDQYLCAVGGFHILRFNEHGIRDYPLSQELVAPLQDYLMLFDTHQYRRASDVIASQLENVERNHKTIERMVEMVDEGHSLMQQGKWLEFGSLLDEAWTLKKSLSDTVSTPKIDCIYEKAKSSGAIGGKLLGGGGGGFIVFFVEPDKQEAVKKALDTLTHVPFRFENSGSTVVYRDKNGAAFS